MKSGYRRVTEILQAYTDFSMIDPAVLANAADRGSRVHRFCELYIKNLLIESVDNDCKPYFDSFKFWFDSVVEEVFFIEERLYCNDLKITGQIDLICSLRNSDKKFIIDFKTPQNPSKTWALQTAAYKYLAEKNLEIKIDYRGCLMLDRHAEPPKFLSYDNDMDFELFKWACHLYEFFH